MKTKFQELTTCYIALFLGFKEHANLLLKKHVLPGKKRGTDRWLETKPQVGQSNVVEKMQAK